MPLEENKKKMPPVVRILNFEIKGDDRGSLISLENKYNIPFDIKRVYYIFSTQEGVVRGKHAHKRLSEVLVAASGSVEIRCEYNHNKEVITLDRPDKGLLIGGMVWRDLLNFSPDAVIIVLADDYYNEEDYIRNYDEFIREDLK
jgi:dTDP-4-dehydrorhamnose 3,5-epimerase-like enzyme